MPAALFIHDDKKRPAFTRYGESSSVIFLPPLTEQENKKLRMRFYYTFLPFQLSTRLADGLGPGSALFVKGNAPLKNGSPASIQYMDLDDINRDIIKTAVQSQVFWMIKILKDVAGSNFT
jgi:hypothetical protein